MNKILKIFISIIILLFFALYILLFTSFGNKLLNPLIQNKINQSGLDIKLKFFKLRFNEVELILDFKDIANININGDIKPLKLAFDLDYFLDINKKYLNNFNLNLKDNLNFKGEISGNIKDFVIKGNGEIFGTTNLNADFKDYTLKQANLNSNFYDGNLDANFKNNNIILKVKNIDLAKLLSISSYPKYINGRLDLNADLNTIDFTNFNGSFDAYANGVFNKNVINKELNIKLPTNTKYNLDLKATLKNNIINFNSKINTDLVNLEKLNGEFDANNIILDSNFVLNINDFSKFNFLVDRNLKGKAIFDGTLDFDKILFATLKSNDLYKGKLNISLNNNILNATLNNLDFSAFMKGIDMMDLYDANTNIIANYDISKLNGKIDLDLSNGKLKKNNLTNTILQFTKKDITKDIYHTANATIILNKDLNKLNANLIAKNSKINIQNGLLDSKNNNINIPFELIIDKANFTGEIINKNDNLKINFNVKNMIKNNINNILDEKTEKKIENKIDNFIKKIF